METPILTDVNILRIEVAKEICRKPKKPVGCSRSATLRTNSSNRVLARSQNRNLRGTRRWHHYKRSETWYITASLHHVRTGVIATPAVPNTRR